MWSFLSKFTSIKKKNDEDWMSEAVGEKENDSSFDQQPTRLPNGNMKFNVHKVEPEISRNTNFERNPPVLPLKVAFQKFGRVEYVSEQKDNKKIVLQTFRDNNILAEAICIAFFEHFPLRLSPDVIWIAILQGVTIHINENAEKLRSKFVSHEGKETISIFRPDIRLGSSSNAWESTIDAFVEGIHKKTHSSLHPIMETTFSTTTTNERTCMHIAIMDMMKSYFEYIMYCGCGIPWIELTGTAADWTRLRQQAQRLAHYDLTWWIDDHLDTVLAHFERAAMGMMSTTDAQFWRSIVYEAGGSGMIGDPKTGWVQCFFPYIQSGDGTFERNTHLSEWKKDGYCAYRPGQEVHGMAWQGHGRAVKEDTFPGSVSQAPFVFVDMTTTTPEQQRHDMIYVGGLAAVVQGKDDHVIEIQTAWAVVEALS